MIALRSFIFLTLFTLITGLLYPGISLIFGLVFFPHQSKGSLYSRENGVVIGSRLIAQKFIQDKYFWPRFSATDWDALPGEGSSLPLYGNRLYEALQKRPEYQGNYTLKFASASGLDPHITKDQAYFQVPRIAKARELKEEDIKDLINESCEGLYNKLYVNVLHLNLLLDEKENVDSSSKGSL